jgi:hypothetical protein
MVTPSGAKMLISKAASVANVYRPSTVAKIVTGYTSTSGSMPIVMALP